MLWGSEARAQATLAKSAYYVELVKSLLVVSLLFLSTALLPDGLPAASWFWESLNGLGLTAMVLLVVLVFEAQTPSPPTALRQHQAVAILAMILTALHVLGFRLFDPLLLEHLKPSAPWSMLSALLAVLLLLILCVASSTCDARSQQVNSAARCERVTEIRHQPDRWTAQLRVGRARRCKTDRHLRRPG